MLAWWCSPKDLMIPVDVTVLPLIMLNLQKEQCSLNLGDKRRHSESMKRTLFFLSRIRDIENGLKCCNSFTNHTSSKSSFPKFTYGPKQSKPSESDARSSDFNSCESNCSEETHESMPERVVNEPNVVSQPKVWSDAPIIEEYESDSEDEHVSLPTKEQEIPSFAFINTVKHVKTPRQTVKEQNTCSQNPNGLFFLTSPNYIFFDPK
ncbi:hypothetical protein Tco_0028872 [Tanacetum coccineum]